MIADEANSAVAALIIQSELNLWPASIALNRAIDWFNIDAESELGKSLTEAIISINGAIIELRIAHKIAKGGENDG